MTPDEARSCVAAMLELAGEDSGKMMAEVATLFMEDPEFAYEIFDQQHRNSSITKEAKITGQLLVAKLRRLLDREEVTQ